MGRLCWQDDGDRCCLVVTVVRQMEDRGRQHQTTQRLLADLGCPVEMILDERLLRRLKCREVEGRTSNFGWLSGYMVRAAIPELHFDHQVRAYGNVRAVRIARDEGFDGIAGKPFFDHFHWSNGDGGELCMESWGAVPSTA